MPQDLVEGYGYPQLTPEIKEMILSRNLARLMDVDLDTKRETIADDEFARRRAENGKPTPGRRWRSEMSSDYPDRLDRPDGTDSVDGTDRRAVYDELAETLLTVACCDQRVGVGELGSSTA